MSQTSYALSPGTGDSSGFVTNHRSGLALAVLLCWQLMVILDGTIVNIALSAIRGSLDFSETGLSWVTNAYALAFGGLLLLGGRAGDILGRRRVLVFGVLLFTAASAVGGLAPSSTVLILARVVQGIGAAIAAPSTLSLIVTNFQEEAERRRAFSLLATISGVGSTVGLIVGGILTSWLSWHWIFFINVPIGLAVAFLAPRWILESERHPGRFDLLGAVSATIGVTALVYGFIRSAEEGWADIRTLGSFIASVVLIAAFIGIEHKAAQPILPLRLLQDRTRATALMAMLLTPSAMFGIFFFLTQYLENVQGYSAIRTGFSFLPLTVALITAARLAPISLVRFGVRRHVSVAGLFIVAGALGISRIDVNSDFLPVLLGPLALLGFGIGSTFPALSITIMNQVDPQDSGAASGILQTCQQIGGATGLSILVTIFGTVHRTALETGKAPLVAVTEGMSTGFIGAACLAAAIVVVAFLGFTRVSSRSTPESRPAVTFADSH